jgi:hypothetical protein
MPDQVLSINTATASRCRSFIGCGQHKKRHENKYHDFSPMIMSPAHSNLVLSWLWILLGFVTGMVMGMFFHGENWLGGYGSFKRRMYRLAHISFFGLGVVNLCFWLTAQSLTANHLVVNASRLFIVGAITMPICCILMAHFPKTHMLFAIPVMSLIAAAALTLLEVAKS